MAPAVLPPPRRGGKLSAHVDMTEPGAGGAHQMPMYPNPDESVARLHAAGWSVGEVRAGSSWLVTG